MFSLDVSLDAVKEDEISALYNALINPPYETEDLSVSLFWHMQ